MVSTAAFHARVRGSVPGLGGLKETKLFLPHPRVKVSIVGSLRDREVACSASDRQGSNFESCVWRTVSSQSSHHPQEVLLAQFSLYVHKGGLKPDSFHLSSLSLQSQKAVFAHLLVKWTDTAFCLYTAVRSSPPPPFPKKINYLFRGFFVGWWHTDSAQYALDCRRKSSKIKNTKDPLQWNVPFSSFYPPHPLREKLYQPLVLVVMVVMVVVMGGGHQDNCVVTLQSQNVHYVCPITSHQPIVASMLNHCLRHWPKNETKLDHRHFHCV